MQMDGGLRRSQLRFKVKIRASEAAEFPRPSLPTNPNVQQPDQNIDSQFFTLSSLNQGWFFQLDSNVDLELIKWSLFEYV